MGNSAPKFGIFPSGAFMCNDELVKKIESELQRKLTPEEYRFLALATRLFNEREKPKRKATTRAEAA